MANVIDALQFNNDKYSLTLPYGSCSTAASTAAKVVTVNNFNLDTGAMIAVKFTITNSAASPTLNVNSTGAKAIYYKGAAITAGYLAANKTYMFVYNGAQWELMGDVDTNTSPKNATITLTAGKGLTDGGNFTTNQSSAETITFNVGAGTGITVTDDAVAVNINSTDSLGTIGTTSKLYAVGVDANGKLCANVPWTDNNTCNTAGSHEKSDKLFLVGCLNQGPYYETFSNSKCYASGGYLYSNGTKVLTSHQSLSNYSTLSNTIKSLSISGKTITYTKGDGTTGTLTTQDTDTTYSAVTQSATGLMSAADKVKLDGIATGANNYSLPTASSSTLGGIKIGTGLGISSGTVSVSYGTTSTTAAAGNHGHSNLGTLTINSGSTSMFTVQYNSSNKFRVASNGGVYGSRYYTSGADYSELMEWADQNADKEDRRGYFVTIAQDETIKIANSEDDVIGVISSTPSVIGNDATFEWHKKYLTDVYGNYIMEEVFYPETTNENGEVIPEHTMMEPKLNPEYDPNMEYVPRSARSEWAAVGMLGQLVVRDDGTCQPGKYCKCNNDGIATISEGREGWKVLKRLDKTHIRILFK